MDEFSWREVRDLATAIIEDCQVYGGWGGIALIGQKRIWFVQVSGIRPGGGDSE